MKYTRREVVVLLGCGVLWASTLRAMPDSSWRQAVRPWLQALVPADEQGAGADDPEVWAALEARRAEPDFALWMDRGFGMLRDTVIPKEEGELLQLLENTAFLSEFHDIVLMCYYGTAAGWRDLGLRNSPQPEGFEVEG